MLYRRQRSGVARLPAPDPRPPEGTIKAPDSTTVLEYLTVADAAEEAHAAQGGWRELAAANRRQRL